MFPRSVPREKSWAAGAPRGVQRLRGGEDAVVSFDSPGDEDALEVHPGLHRILWRAAVLGVVFSVPLWTAPIALIVPIFRRLVWYRILAYSLGQSGAAFIKWGQWSSVRPDMFPQALCDVLKRLHAGAPVHAWEYTRAQVEAAVGAPIEKRFDSFNPVPIASGSIAQVYSAFLDGRHVAVKVRHPDVAEQIKLDFRIMRAVGEFLDAIPGLGWLNLASSMEQFSHTIASQTRLDIEGTHLDLFNRNFRSLRASCGFPEAVLKSEAVLVESFEHGQLATRFIGPFARLRARRELERLEGGDMHAAEQAEKGLAQKLREQVRESWGARLWRAVCCCFGGGMSEDVDEADADEGLGYFVVCKGADIYLKMLLHDNLMHADLHPGNILVQRGDAKHSHRGTRIVLVDAGMVAQLKREEKENFIGFLHTLGAGDGEAASDCLLRFSREQTCASPEQRAAFRAAMSLLFAETCRGYGEAVDIGLVLRRTLQTLHEHRVRIDINYATLVLNLLCLEGLAAALQPSYSLLDGAKPLLEAYRSIPRPLNRVLFPCAYFFKRIHDRRTLLHMQRREEQRLAGRPPPAAPRRRGLAGAAQNALVPAAISAGTSALLFLAAGLLHSPGADAPGSLAPAKSPSVQRGHR